MAYLRHEEAVFGIVGLGTVGYVLKNPDNTNNGIRITAGITEVTNSSSAGMGTYQADVSFPDGFIGTIVWDTGQATPLYTSKGINPGSEEYFDAKISSRAIGTGTGANIVTITLTETGGTPKIVSASVKVWNNIEDTLIAVGTTDSNGQVGFNLDNGTYKVYNTKLGSYSFTNPQTLVVSGNTNASYIGTPISVTAPTSPDICKLYIYAYNTDGTVIASGLVGNIRIKTLPYTVSTLNYEGEEIALQYDVTGAYWYANMPKGATIIVNIFTMGYQGKEAVVPNVPTELIKNLIWLN